MPDQTKHILLGSGGAIGAVLSRELLDNNERVKLVSRSGRPASRVESFTADLLNYESVEAAVESGSTVYLLAGLPYNSSVWQQQWPAIMENVIAACTKKDARLVFFDNVYMYGRVDGAMTEDTPVHPCSKKGEVRAKVASKLMDEVKKGNLRAAIARSADFYGPHASHVSLPYIFVFSKLANGKPAEVLVRDDTRHSYTFTSDCGKALYLLAKSEDTFGQIWHMPTASPPLTDKQFVEVAAAKLGVEPHYRILRKWMVGLAGFFDRQTKEVYEMLYQNQYDYVFDSTKFEERFGFRPTPYEEGIEQTLDFFAMISNRKQSQAVGTVQ